MFRDVVAQYRRALAAKPDYLAAETGLAYLLSTCADPSVRDGPAAVPLAEDVNRRTGGSSAVALGTLAAAYAETGDFSRAIDSIRRAIVIAKAQNDLHLATIFQGHLQLYQSRRPLRDYQ
jgi:tetratricopeptide (TPR) repeat protein